MRHCHPYLNGGGDEIGINHNGQMSARYADVSDADSHVSVKAV